MNSELFNQLIDAALKEDIGSGDHSTLSCIPKDKLGKAELKLPPARAACGMC